MLYRKLGKTGWKVSALSLGGSSIGGAFGQVPEKQAIRVVRSALDLGINFFNSAPYYGFAKSEILLGKALKGVPGTAFTWPVARAAQDRSTRNSTFPRLRSPVQWMKA